MDDNNTDYDTKDLSLDTKMHKAIAIIQFKLEGQVIMRRPEFGMQDRLLLDKVDYENRALVVDGVSYAMKDVDKRTSECTVEIVLSL